MKAIQVNSLPLKEVISDIATAFDTEYTENCDEFTVELPSNIGKGRIRGINFERGLGIIRYDCTFNEDFEIQFVINEIHPLKFLYCIEGELGHRFGNGNTLHTIGQYKKAIVASQKKNGHVLCFKANIRVTVNSLEISRKLFSEKISCELKSLDQGLKELFGDVGAKKEFYHDGFYSLELADSFNEMETFEETDFLKKLFLEGKAYQLLTKQLLEYQDDIKDVDQRRFIRKSEIRLIEEAASILSDEMAKGQTIKSLAKRVGLNPNKLQSGFRRFYHVTVNQYLHSIRLERARELLLNRNFSMAQIVEELGLSSGSYFSKIFKEKYGVTPSKFRSNYFKNLKDNDLGVSQSDEGR